MNAPTNQLRDQRDPTRDWRPMAEVWAEIVAEYPELRLGSTATAQNNFRNSFGTVLVEAGILSRGKGRSWWVDRRRFKPAFRLLVAGRPLGDLGESALQVSPP